MPKFKSITLNLNLLKPQSNPEKLPIKLFRWLLLSGKYLFVFVEALVLIAFASRFKLDADIASKKEAIDEQIPYIESLKSYEILIRQTQLKLETNDSIKTNSPDWPLVLKKVADQIPASVKITTINIGKNANAASIHITGQTPENRDLTSFILGLKEDKTFSNVNLANVGLEQGVIKFTVDTTAKVTSTGEKGI